MTHKHTTWAVVFATLIAAGAALARPPLPHTDAEGDPLPEQAAARFGTVRWRTTTPVVYLAFLPERDGKRTLLSVDASGLAQVWDVKTGRETRRLDADPLDAKQPAPPMASRPTGRASLNAEGGLLAVVGREQQARVWDLDRGRELAVVGDADQHVAAVAVTEGYAATVGLDNRLAVWTLPTGTLEFQTRELVESGGVLVAAEWELAFTRDGKGLVAVARDPRGVRAWHYALGSKKDVVALLEVRAGADPVRRPLLSPDGGYLVLPRASGRVGVTPLGNIPEAVPSFRGPEGVAVRFAWGADGTRVVGLPESGGALVWDRRTGRLVREWTAEERPANAPAAVAVSADGNLLAESTRTGIRLFDLAGGQGPAPAAHNTAVVHLHFGPDGKSLHSRSADAACAGWDLGKRAELYRFLPGRTCVASAAAPDGKTLAWADLDGRVHIVDSRDGAGRVTIRATDGRAWVPAFSGDGEKLVLVDPVRPDEFRVHEVANGKRLPDVQAPRWHALIRPDGAMQTGFGQDRSPLVFGPPGQRHLSPMTTFTRTGSGPPALAYAPDGHTLVIDLGNGQAILADLHGGALRAVLDPGGKKLRLPKWTEDPRVVLGGLTRPAAPETVAFSPDGRLIAHATGEAVQLWDARTLTHLGRFAGHSGPVTAVAFSPDGNTLATGGMDTTVLVWPLEPVRKKLPGPAEAKLTKEDLQAAWTDLDSREHGVAHAALERLVADPARSVPFLTDQLAGVAAPRKDEWATQRFRALEVLHRAGTAEARAALEAEAKRDNGLLTKTAKEYLRRFDEK